MSGATYDLWQVDAFTDRLFGGNPAAVMILPSFFPDPMLQAIAAENNLAETAFVVPNGPGRYLLRWFTPEVEVPLCGHATLATAHVLWTETDESETRLVFDTQSGPLTVEQTSSAYAMDFPADHAAPYEEPEGLSDILGARPSEVLAGKFVLAVYPEADDVVGLRPDLARLATLAMPGRGDPNQRCLIVTAPGDGETDFVSRMFAPMIGIPEDPVTGAAHCLLTPFWAARLGKPKMKAWQASKRGGELLCTDQGDRVRMEGQAVTYMRGRISLSG